MAEQQQQPQLRIEKLLREMVNRNAWLRLCDGF